MIYSLDGALPTLISTFECWVNKIFLNSEIQYPKYLVYELCLPTCYLVYPLNMVESKARNLYKASRVLLCAKTCTYSSKIQTRSNCNPQMSYKIPKSMLNLPNSQHFLYKIILKPIHKTRWNLFKISKIHEILRKSIKFFPHTHLPRAHSI